MVTAILYTLMKELKTAQLRCPNCSHEQFTQIPEDQCLPFYRCEKCKEMIGVPAKSKNCCVICEYSDSACPISIKGN